jgi:hypothetical protein
MARLFISGAIGFPSTRFFHLRDSNICSSRLLASLYSVTPAIAGAHDAQLKHHQMLAAHVNHQATYSLCFVDIN